MSQITWHHLRRSTFSLCPIKTGEKCNFLDAKGASAPWYASEYCLLGNWKQYNEIYTRQISHWKDSLEGHVSSLSVVFWGRILLICDISGSRASSHGSRGCTVISLTPTPGRLSYHWRPDNQEIMTVLGTNALWDRDYYCTRLIHTPSPYFGPDRERWWLKFCPRRKTFNRVLLNRLDFCCPSFRSSIMVRTRFNFDCSRFLSLVSFHWGLDLKVNKWLNEKGYRKISWIPTAIALALNTSHQNFMSGFFKFETDCSN